ncbi:FimV/HubP family polar landmark protein [Psychrobacter sp. FME5]|uniref:FimV/HubP family polar landmark protein n=1 Tax=Psychrobacter sp. FME5 TaxID=2487706 RepID=UPI0017883A31|nr:FimV/HubP family polar landmark protein [Psychrobacter sp. FME5]MBE0444103.1 LPXTG cell wall anchor domain-containing protein [Psychrobacter sp. FME5]
MDNMLYIIAGLVLILLIAGLVLRKKKAQQPPTQPYVKSGRDASTPTPMPKADIDTTIPSNKEGDNKFDHIAIAQRFMDQQRYDKAIETLNRGLIERPKDNQLSLKLLSIYATINQPENFNKVYDAIKIQNDTESIVLADELKTLFFEEQNSELTQNLPVEEEKNFESIDFDLPTHQVDQQNTLAEEPVVDSYSDTSINETIEDSFDLTLSDLENDLNEPNTTDAAPATTLDMADDESLNTVNIDTSGNDAAIVEDSNLNNLSNSDDLSDFDFSLDLPEENDTLTTTSIASDSADSTNEEMALEDEEFVLDFDDLVSDTDKDTDATIAAELTSDASQSLEDDFTLSLESLDESNSLESALESDKPTFESNSDIDGLVLEDNGFESINLEESFKDNELEISQPEETSVAPTAPMLFDDNTSLDDAYDLDAPTAATPVDVETEIATEESFSTEGPVETAEDFSSRFAADFDFVKALDSNQVTLDLAGQYLQLGEYDSAKRLLNEVINQGNSEQQSQAQALLERTA